MGKLPDEVAFLVIIAVLGVVNESTGESARTTSKAIGHRSEMGQPVQSASNAIRDCSVLSASEPLRTCSRKALGKTAGAKWLEDTTVNLASKTVSRSKSGGRVVFGIELQMVSNSKQLLVERKQPRLPLLTFCWMRSSALLISMKLSSWA